MAGSPRVVALPAGARFTAPSFSPDAKSMAFVLDQPTGLELWVVDVASARARKLTEPVVNMTAGIGLRMAARQFGLAGRGGPGRDAVPRQRWMAPDRSEIEESAGRVAPVRTYQDLLRSPGDEALFDHYFTAS